MKNHDESVNWFPPIAVVAEGDLMLRVTLAALLSCDGYRVFQQQNERTAISYIDSVSDLDVLFIDLDEPEWKTLVKRVRHWTPDAFVIGISGNASVAGNADLESFGIQACLFKPIQYRDVRRALSETVERRRAA